MDLADAHPVVIIIEDDPLTVWSLQSLLQSTCDVITTPDPEQALELLSAPQVRFVICGSPVEGDAQTISRIAASSQADVIALVSDADCDLPATVTMIEKPFVLARLADLVLKARLPEKGHL